MSEKNIIWGAGGHAQVVAEGILSNHQKIFGFIDDVNTRCSDSRLMGCPIWGSLQEILDEHKIESLRFVIGFGHCAARLRLVNRLREIGDVVKSVIHPNAIVSASAKIGEGVYVGPGAVIEANVHVGDGVIVNAGAIICHDVVVGSATSVCPRVVIGGESEIGKLCWLGIGCTLKDKIYVGECSYIGAGASLVNDLPGHVLAYGVPARVIREITDEF